MNVFKKNLLIALLSLFSTTFFSQGFTPPAEGNAAIYFVRVSDFGFAVSFEYFHNQEFIGISKGKNYMRFEYPAGKHLFWASSEDKEFLNCTLKAGETYIVLVNIEMGVWKARIGLEPLVKEHPVFLKARALVMETAPFVTSEAKIKSTQQKLEERGFFKEMMLRYDKEWQYMKNTKVITEEMFIPKENLK